MDTEKKLAALVKIAEILNQNGITWAVGASSLLYIKGITHDFHDIDIMISENDVEKVKALLSDYETLQQRIPNAQYKSKAFLEYMIEGIEFDIIAGFTIVAEDVEHYFPLKKENIKEITFIDNMPIPLQSVEEWKTYYSLMGKIEKAQMIELHLKD
ncbi:hypothetical protein OXPF_37470 [Oxobacter pfennigii]|uniref:Nucleotidyltransferase family protein n=1 Tax=Oxobacter pfennigii TaxID=36849 RepID=A0A0P9AC71_9CLOT|nr:hypothetical protein [Oxobacter pfennigii]KPU42693.1 hypothetical protein OXPF_37470 [Oxobacter pfennigii]